ncbi:MAG: radical SAM protein [Polyangiaceae bacterium]
MCHLSRQLSVHPSWQKRRQERQRSEVGRIEKDAPIRIALTYPSPYHVAMSSLGYQTIYRLIQNLPDFCAERFFLPDESETKESFPEPVMSFDSERRLEDFPIIALSVAYELEIAGLVRLFERAKLPVLREDRDDSAPLVIAGGPLTFSNPIPLLPFVDVVILGEAEELLPWVLERATVAKDRQTLLEEIASNESILVPALGKASPGVIAKVDDELLPAHSVIRTPHTELSDMFLIEAERGCSRGCQYCVMRRSTNGGMRIVSSTKVLATIPEDVHKVGLVGAAVSDHPEIVGIVSALVDRGMRVGLSSLRPDKLKEPFVAALARAGYKTLTTALDGPSARMRAIIDRRSREDHYRSAAQFARQYGMDRLKLYLMIGLPGETDEDIDECVGFVRELSRIVPIALGISPFCSKRNTPLDGTPYAGVGRVQDRLERLRRGLSGRADVRATSAKWAWVEQVLAQGGQAEGLALYEAVKRGGQFSAYKRAFEALGHRADGTGYESIALPDPVRRQAKRLPTVDPTQS